MEESSKPENEEENCCGSTSGSTTEVTIDEGSEESSSTNEGARFVFEEGDKEELFTTSVGIDENVEFGNNCLK